MSSAGRGYGEGFYYGPEDQEQLSALRRRQAYANALLQGDTPQGQYGGLASAGNKLLGAFLANRTDKQEGDLAHSAQDRYTSDMASFLKGGATAAQVSNGPGMSAPTPIPSATGPSPAPQAIPSAQGTAPPPTPLQTAQDQSPMDRLLATRNPALIQQFAPQLFTHQQTRDDKLWENDLPMSRAARDQSGLQLQNQEALSGFNNQLPMTAAQRASNDVSRGQLGVSQAQFGETKRHNMADENLKAHPFGMGVSDATGDGFLKQLPPGIAGQVKAIAEYRQPAPQSRSQQSMALMNAVSQYRPDYDSTQFGAKSKARNDFTTGKNGNTVRSLNVAVQHLDQLGQLSDAMGNGNLQMVNKLGNLFATQTGSPAPTNFNAAKQLVGDEIVKAIVGAGGGVSDREEAAHNISAASSPQQLAGVIKTYQGLLSGQLVGLRQQYQKSTGLKDFEEFLAPETRAKLESHGAASGAAGGGHPPPPPGFVVH